MPVIQVEPQESKEWGVEVWVIFIPAPQAWSMDEWALVVGSRWASRRRASRPQGVAACFLTLRCQPDFQREGPGDGEESMSCDPVEAGFYLSTAKLLCLYLKQTDSINLAQLFMEKSTTKKDRLSRVDAPNLLLHQRPPKPLPH